MNKDMSKAVLAILVLLPVMLTAQNLPCRTYGGMMNERAHALVQSAGEDGGYLMAGFTTMPMDTNLLIVKIDSMGDTLKAMISYGSNTEIATSMIRTTLEPGYILTGWTRSYGPGIPKANIFVIKLTMTLAVQWGKVYSSSGTYEDRAYSIIEVSPAMGAGYAVVGWTEMVTPTGIVVVRLDPLGNQLWLKIYRHKTYIELMPILLTTGGHDIVELPSSAMLPMGGFAVTGRTDNAFVPNWDAYVMCIDNMGIIQWFKVMMGMDDDEGYSIILDGLDVVAAGWTKSFGPQPTVQPYFANIFVWKISLMTTFDVWNKAYGWAADDEKVMDEQSLLKTSDGNYVLSGWTQSVGPGIPNPNFLIMKLDQMTGNILWSRVHPSIPGAGSEQAYPIIETYNNTGLPKGFAIAGWTNSFGVGPLVTEDFHFLTLDPLGNRPVCVLPLRPDTGSFWSEQDSAVLYTEFFDMTLMNIKDTSVMYVDVCAMTVDTNDVGPTGIYFDIPSPFDSTQTVTPLCSLYNYGNTTVSYNAQLDIGTFYPSTFNVVNHAPKTTIPATFSSYTDWPRGTHTVTCISQLATDSRRSNDTLVSVITVHVHDVGTQEINYPTGNLDSAATFTPQAKVKNYGNVQETFNVKYTINGPTKTTWTDDSMVTIGAGNTLAIDFAQWEVIGAGNYTTKCSTELTGDMNNSNDKQDSVFTVVGQMDYNVGTVAIYMPTAGDIDSTATITPQAKVKNYGSNTETFNVKFTITGPAKATWVDDSSVTLTSGQELTINFADWTVGPQGDYTAKCSTELATDMFADNDKKQVLFTIVVAPPGTPGWALKESIPHPQDLKTNKYVKDGGSLTSEHGKIYAFPGNKSWQFFKYTQGTPGYWTVLESIPYGPKPSDPTKPNKKKISKGAALCAEGDKIYATKGNGTTEFWVYYINAEGTIPADTWIQLASVPVTKGLKGGTSILHWGRAHDHQIYLLAGSQKAGQPNFFAYDIEGDTTGGSPWATLTSVPLDPDGKAFKDGSCIVLADKKIWALKGSGKHNYFYMYDSVLKTWRQRETIPLMYPTSLIAKPKKNKVKAGGAMTVCDDFIYVIKGGGKQDFWAYNYDDSTWTPKDTIPRLSAKSVPKAGAALTELDDKVWLLKGNNSAEFWCYTPATTKLNIKTQISNITQTMIPTQSEITTQMTGLLQVNPNPFINSTVINYTVPVAGKVSLKLYNAIGRLVKTVTNEYHNPGVYTFNLTDIASGVYFLRYENSNRTSEVKLIVQ